MKTLKLKLVTPERLVSEQEVVSVTLPIQEGEVTILPEHEPYIGALHAGEILVHTEESDVPQSLAISGGFVEFVGNTLTILADTAERAEEIDMKRAEEAREKAEKIKSEKSDMSAEEYAFVAAALEKELARIKVARKHHSRRGITLTGSD